MGATAALRCAAAPRGTTSHAIPTGHEQARGLWNWTERALDRIEELAGDALRRPGSFRLAADAEEREQIRAEYEAFRDDGIEAESFDDLPGVLAGRFEGGILHASDGALQPARWVRRLAALAADAGAEIRELSASTT